MNHKGCLSIICESICKGTTEPIIICDYNFPIQCNDLLLNIFGYKTANELLSLSMREIIDKHFNPSTIIKNGISYPAEIKDLSFTTIHYEDGSQKTTAAKVKEKFIEGKTIYFVSIKKDQTEIKDIILTIDNSGKLSKPSLNKITTVLVADSQIQRHLIREFSIIADGLPSLIWIVSSEGTTIYQNIKVQETMGVNTLKECWQDCVHPDDLANYGLVWNEGISTGKYFSIIVRYRHIKQQPNSDGQYTYRHHFLQSTPILRSDGTVSLFVIDSIDIQDLKDAEAEKQHLIASEKLATEALKLKSAFLSMMSHEIRTPLFGILGNISLLMDNKISKIQKEFLNAINESASSMLSVIQDILDFSRIEAGKLQIISEPILLNKIINECINKAKEAAEKKKLLFEFVPLTIPIKVLGDSTCIIQVLSNFSSNAIKFTQSGSISVKTDVSDTGIGFGNEMAEKLFTPWMQEDSSSRRAYGGRGLGLAISKALVELMGGKIGATSKQGSGSCFWFQLNLPTY